MYNTQLANQSGDIAPSRLSLEQMDQLINDGEPGNDPQTVLDATNQDAATEVDGYCKRYVTPFNPVPNRVKALHREIWIHNLFKKRPQMESEEGRKNYEDAIDFLKMVANGKADIPGAALKEISASSSSAGGSFSASEKVFTDQSLKDM